MQESLRRMRGIGDRVYWVLRGLSGEKRERLCSDRTADKLDTGFKRQEGALEHEDHVTPRSSMGWMSPAPELLKQAGQHTGLYKAHVCCLGFLRKHVHLPVGIRNEGKEGRGMHRKHPLGAG